MTAWEYAQLTRKFVGADLEVFFSIPGETKGDETVDDVASGLARLGAAGWDLAEVHTVEYPNGIVETVYTFKRQRKPAPIEPKVY